MYRTGLTAGRRIKRVACWGVCLSLLLVVGASAAPTESYFFVTRWGSKGAGNGQFNNPCGLAVDRSGNVYVTDRLNLRVQKFRGDGTYVTQWGSRGTGNGQFSFPFGVAVDASGKVYVTDGNCRIQKFQLAQATIAGKVTLIGSTRVNRIRVTANPGNHWTTTDADGSYIITGLSAGKHTVTPSKSGWEFTARAVTTPPPAQDIDFTGRPATYTVSGKVTLTGSKQVSGITVTASPGNHRATTKADGSYKITGLLRGTYTVTPAKKGRKFAGKAVTLPPSRVAVSSRGTKASSTIALLTGLTGTPSRKGAEITFSLSAPGFIDARILSLAGRPIRTLAANKPLGPGAQTLLWDRRSDAGLSVPSGTYLLRVVARDPEGGQSTAPAALALR